MARTTVTLMKYNNYWDASIPMEYYEEGFLDFEQYLRETGQEKKATPDEPHAN